MKISSVKSPYWFKKIFTTSIFFLVLFYCIGVHGAQDVPLSIQPGKIGHAEIGRSVEEVVKLYKEQKYIIKHMSNTYTVYPKKSMIPVLEMDYHPNLTRINDQKFHPIIRIKTSNPLFKLSDGTALIGATLNELSLLYGNPTLYRQNVNSPEWVEFEKNILDKVTTINSYRVYTRLILNKTTDHLGNFTHTGKYVGDYSIFTDEFDDNAFIESVEFLGNAIFKEE